MFEKHIISCNCHCLCHLRKGSEKWLLKIVTILDFTLLYEELPYTNISFSIISKLMMCSRSGKKACHLLFKTHRNLNIYPFKGKRVAFKQGMVAQFRKMKLKGDSYLKVTLI